MKREILPFLAAGSFLALVLAAFALHLRAESPGPQTVPYAAMNHMIYDAQGAEEVEVRRNVDAWIAHSGEAHPETRISAWMEGDRYLHWLVESINTTAQFQSFETYDRCDECQALDRRDKELLSDIGNFAMRRIASDPEKERRLEPSPA